MLQQTKTLPASLVQNNFGALVKRVRKGEYKEIIVENRGEPIVAIINVEELEAMKTWREQEKRKAALALLRLAREAVQARLTKKLTDTDAIEIADRVSQKDVDA